MGYFEGEIPTVVSGGNNAGGFGYGSDAWVMIILFALIFGNGFGWGGNNAGGALTRNDLCQEFSFNDLQNAVRGISNGICDSTFALNNTMTNGFAGVQQTLCQGFSGINTAILTSANATDRGIADLGYKLQSCCCELGRGQERISCEIANSANSVIQAGNANTQRILDYLCNEKISALQAENSLLTAQLSQNSQTATILNAVNRTPVPAYVVANPYAGCGYGYNNSGCGCGSCGL